MDDNNRKGQFGVAYVSALATAAGYITYKPEPDLDSVDLGISAKSEDIEGAPSIELQIKTYSYVFDDGPEFPYRIKKKNYNDLRCKVLKPRYLVVVNVPRPEEPWLIESEHSLTLLYGAYYLSLKGSQEIAGKTTTVKMLRAQLLTVRTLTTLLQQASNQGLFL
ncbi:DUF4365 domain-containing protein [Archangium sp.]|uniref:DUF4365 domain-containing protein n=1 Tax=Archangium sp. TaxID=1872627 RepID=UPI002D4B4605|nr:DUF4365 domain-containing protein [Archangium sp.]HYO53399.1 DUF4365 domain-containing protein [Archangium sp.]